MSFVIPLFGTKMSVIPLVSTSRVLDSVVYSFFLMILAGASLYGFGLAHQYICVSEAKKLGMFSTFWDKAFPMPGKKWTFNLTHTLLLSILIALLSMMHHPAQDSLQENALLQKKKKEKAEKNKGE